METTPDTFKPKIIGFVNLIIILRFLPIMTSGYTLLTTSVEIFRNLCKNYVNLGKDGSVAFQINIKN